eukprot:948225_1
MAITFICVAGSNQNLNLREPTIQENASENSRDSSSVQNQDPSVNEVTERRLQKAYDLDAGLFPGVSSSDETHTQGQYRTLNPYSTQRKRCEFCKSAKWQETGRTRRSLKFCEGCPKIDPAYYCSRRCQKKDWNSKSRSDKEKCACGGRDALYFWGDLCMGQLVPGLLNGTGYGHLVRDHGSPGVLYDGYFENGEPSKGKSTYPSGATYEGDYQGTKRHGTGTYRFSNGDVYKGEWKNGKMCGKGEYTRNGNVYKGEWKNGEMCGKGEYTFRNGNVSIGDKNGAQRRKCEVVLANKNHGIRRVVDDKKHYEQKTNLTKKRKLPKRTNNGRNTRTQKQKQRQRKKDRKKRQNARASKKDRKKRQNARAS